MYSGIRSAHGCYRPYHMLLSAMRCAVLRDSGRGYQLAESDWKFQLFKGQFIRRVVLPGQYRSTMVPWYRGTIVPRGTVAPWYLSTAWYRGTGPKVYGATGSMQYCRAALAGT
eukprot:3931947-Rhodomonas_salina.4